MIGGIGKGPIIYTKSIYYLHFYNFKPELQFKLY